MTTRSAGSDSISADVHSYRRAMLLDLDADQLLTTTLAVRKRLDFDRPFEDDVIRDCVRIAMQAP